MRETPPIRHCQPGRRRRCFLSAITPKGTVFHNDTLHSLCTRIIGIEDEYSAVSGILLQQLGDAAIRNGYDVIFCHCPMKPKECEHIIIPALSLGIVTLKSKHGISLSCDRVIHSRRFLSDGIKDCRSVLRFDKKLKAELITEAEEKLKKAKAVHDELEKIYIDAMDFEAMNAYCADFIDKLLSAK